MARYLSVTVVLLTLGILVGETPAGASFSSEGSLSLPSFGAGVDLAWGDYDADGDLDLLVAGDSGLGSFVTRLYRQDPGPVFTSIDPNLPGVNRGSVAWGDEDGDGDLDILLTGDNNGTAVSGIYLQSSPGVFTLKPTTILPVMDGEAAWGDYDNDGDQDVAVTGLLLGGRYSQVYRRNADGSYEWRSGIALSGLSESGVSWVDTDADGDLDLFLNGYDGSTRVSRLYRNDGNESFVVAQDLTGVSEGKAAWCDYDSDGDLDVLLTGRGPGPGGRTTELFANTGGMFYSQFLGFFVPWLSQSDASWGDFNNDGRPDLILCGFDGSSRVTMVIHNDPLFSFQPYPVSGLPGVGGGSVAWGDYNGNGRLDFVVAGETATGSTSIFFRNTIAGAPPPVPSPGVFVNLDPDQLEFALFTTPGMTMNLRIGSTPGGNERWPALSAADGTRRVPAPGNVQTATYVPFQPSPGAWHWSAQNIDASLRGSAFSAEGKFCVFGPAPTETLPDASSYQDFVWADFDGDADPDLAYTRGGDAWTEDGLYLQVNNGGTLSPPQKYFDYYQTSLSAGDFDNDGDLDIGSVLAGTHWLYFINEGSMTFPMGGFPILGIYRAQAADYDNDGDSDFIAWIQSASFNGGRLYRNDGNFSFTAVPVPAAENTFYVSAEWGDYDNDGDFDLVAAGYPFSGAMVGTTRLLRNDGGSLVEVPSPFVGFTYEGDLAWGDFDADGDLDLALSGNTAGGEVLKVYRNDGGAFVDFPTGVSGFTNARLAWGDLNVNGLPELVVSGRSGSQARTRILEFDGFGFSHVALGPAGLDTPTRIDMADFDVDGDLDITLIGHELPLPSTTVFRTYRNDCGPPNPAPSSPSNLAFTYPAGLTSTFTWDPGTDGQTPSAALSYNLRIGTTQTGNEIMSSMSQWNADPMTNSPRWVGGMGNVQLNRSWTVKLPPVPYICWSVQSVDGGGMASPFASLEQVILGPWIHAVEDVPGDQGGQVAIRFGASHLDWSGETQYPVVEYRVWRQVSPGSWSLLETVPAAQLPEYTVFAMTSADSSDLGLPMETFYVSAHTGTPSVTVESPPDSGYSVDNTAPFMPDGFAVAIAPSGISLGWLPSADEDFRTFRIYRGDLPTALTLNGSAAATLVHETTATNWIDPSGDLDVHYYELAAVDQAGNESPRATTLNQSGVGDRPLPGVTRLSPATPSPFRGTTELHLTLDARRQVQVDVFDIGGRHVRTLLDGLHAEGHHVVQWDGTNADGQPAASGIYFVRMTSGSFRDVQRVVLRR